MPKKLNHGELVAGVRRIVEKAGNPVEGLELIKYLRANGFKSAGSGWKKQIYDPAGLERVGSNQWQIKEDPSKLAERLRARRRVSPLAGSTLPDFLIEEKLNLTKPAVVHHDAASVVVTDSHGNTSTHTGKWKVYLVPVVVTLLLLASPVVLNLVNRV